MKKFPRFIGLILTAGIASVLLHGDAQLSNTQRLVIVISVGALWALLTDADSYRRTGPTITHHTHIPFERPPGFDENRPNHYFHDSLGDPATCTEDHSHPNEEEA